MADSVKKIKKILLQMTPAKIIFSFLSVLIIIIFLLIPFVLKSVSYLSNTPFFLLSILTILLLMTRLSVIVSVGIGFVNIILFGVQLTYGAIPALIMVVVSTWLYIMIAKRPTPIDFMITKNVTSALSQLIYISLWIMFAIPLYKILGLSYIISHLTLVYMISVTLYIIFMVICLPIIARQPIPMVFINAMIMYPIQFIIITYLGPGFMNFMINSAGLVV